MAGLIDRATAQSSSTAAMPQTKRAPRALPLPRMVHPPPLRPTIARATLASKRGRPALERALPALCRLGGEDQRQLGRDDEPVAALDLALELAAAPADIAEREEMLGGTLALADRLQHRRVVGQHDPAGQWLALLHRHVGGMKEEGPPGFDRAAD